MIKGSQSSSTVIPTLMVFFIGIILLILQILSVLSNEVIFSFQTILLLAYLGMVLKHLPRYYPKSWILHPLVTFSIIVFVLGYGITNLIFLSSVDTLSSLSLEPVISTAMVKLMDLVLLGAIAMVMGYYSPLANYMTKSNRILRFQANYLPSDETRPLSIPIMTFISIIGWYFSIKSGSAGYGADYDDVVSSANYSQYIALISSAGKLVLIVTAMSFYSAQRTKKLKFWLIFLMILQLTFGFFSGMKSGVGLPFLILIVCQYLQTGKSSRLILMLFFASILVAYAVIEPYRQARNNDATFNNTSIVSIFNTLIAQDNSTLTNNNTSESKLSTLYTISARLNLTQIGSYGLVYADENPVLPPASPAFLENIFIAPLHALIPRFIWNNKPLATLGLWYNQVVMGNSHFSSTGMGLFTHLYFAGGFIAVFLGLYFNGLVLRTLFMLCQPGSSIPGSIIYLASISAMFSLEYNSFIIYLCRELPLELLFMFVIFRSKRLKQNIVKIKRNTLRNVH